MIKSLAKLSCAVVFAVSAAGVAHAGAVLTNGNFENGLTGWTSYTTANGTIAELPSLPGSPAPQSASVVSFNTKGTGVSNALFLNAGKINGPYNSNPGEGGGIFQSFTTTGGVATFSADIAAFYTRTSGASGLGLLSVLIDGVILDSHDFGDVTGGPVTLRSTLGFTTNLSAGTHILSLQATRLFAPGRGVDSQYFDNVSLDVVAVPEPATWAITLMGFGLMGASLRYRRRSMAVALAV
ncbi:MAG: PEPxxWA-CTERM sorting domain-containing protein [Sphingomonas sp.]